MVLGASVTSPRVKPVLLALLRLAGQEPRGRQVHPEREHQQQGLCFPLQASPATCSQI